jgi:hypothetical protein
MSQNQANPPEDLLQVLGRLAQVLNAQKADYALIGGLGAAVRGTVRATRDIDMLLQAPQLDFGRLLDALREEGFQLDVRQAIGRWGRESLLEIRFGRVRIDWLKAALPVFQRILKRSKWEEVGGQRVRVADVEGLLLLKLISFRPQDQADIQAILAANPGQVDLDWVRTEWAHLSGLDSDRAAQFEALVAECYRK